MEEFTTRRRESTERNIIDATASDYHDANHNPKFNSRSSHDFYSEAKKQNKKNNLM